MLKHLSNFCRDEGGATAMEYGLIAALVSVAAITALMQMGGSVDGLFAHVSSGLSSVVTSL